MFSCKGRNEIRSQEQLEARYHSLSTCLDKIHKLSESALVEPSKQICFLVLDEDVTALLEECEEYMILESELEERAISSFESRCLTVMEEIESLVAQ